MSAILSPCGTYRYRLERDVAMEGPVFAFFGVNPSTADATLDDATVRKWTGFVKRWGGRRFIVGNVFAYRSTDVREVAKAADPFGPENRKHIENIVAAADIIVPCWGDEAKVPDRLRGDFALFLLRLRQADKPLKTFGLTKNGSPKHPLMLGYDTPLVPYGVLVLDEPSGKGGA